MTIEQTPDNRKEPKNKPSFRHFLDSLLKKFPEQDPRIPCISCDQQSGENRFFDRDLGGPICSEECFQDLRYNATFDIYIPTN